MSARTLTAEAVRSALPDDNTLMLVTFCLLSWLVITGRAEQILEVLREPLSHVFIDPVDPIKAHKKKPKVDPKDKS